jgi:peptidoglycan/LPS O-acetylase OafA/YrhL
LTIRNPIGRLKDDPMNPDPRRSAPPTAARSLILKIDVCRGLFAFLVVSAHAYDVCWAIHTDAVKALSPGLRNFLHCTLQSGSYWVMGFFVISGYCIQLSVGRLQDAGRFPFFVYAMARLTRIAPLYYAGLVFTLMVECLVAPARPPYFPDGVDPTGWISQLFFLQRPFQTFGAYGPTWSISNEIFYYLLFGALATFGARQRHTAAWRGMAACVVVAWMMQFLYSAGLKNWYTLNAGLMFGLGINWFLGALVAAHGEALVRHRSARAMARAWPLAFASAVALKADGRCPEQMILLALGVAFSLMLLRFVAVAHSESEAAAGTDRPASSRVAGLAHVLGLASYPTYLFHAPILLLLAAAISHWRLVDDWRVTWAVLTASGVGAGLALGWLVERPIMAWRAGFLKGLKGRATTSPAPSNPLAHALRSTITQGT